MAFTFFFRDLPVLEHAVNAVLKLALGRLRIKVWDAGCALGQEPYTLAILFAEKMGDMGFNTLYLDATDYDIENNFGDIVTAGVYKTEELQRIPADIFAKYFEEAPGKPGHHRVIDRIRNRVFSNTMTCWSCSRQVPITLLSYAKMCCCTFLTNSG